MDDSILQRNKYDIDEKFNNNFLELDFMSQTSLSHLMKHTFLIGAEKLLMARKSPTPFDYSTFELHSEYNELNSSNNRKLTAKQNKKVRGNGKYKNYAIQPTYSNESIDKNSKVAFHPSETFNVFPLNVIAFFAVIVLKLASFQVGLVLNFFTFPLRVLNFWFMFIMFPFQTIARIRDHMKRKLRNAIHAFGSMMLSFICNRFKAHKAMLKMGIRLGKAFFCALYVFFVLVSLLVSGFAVSGFVMSKLVQEPIQKTEVLNFDYTKTSPVAIVPMSSRFGTGVASENSARRAIPDKHKLQLTVSLTLPESEYNRKLGVFQVRIESLSDNGKVITGSSYPTMLRFKSQPIRVIETVFNSVPLITGFQSEVQNLKIVIRDFTEGNEPTAGFKVILEQRAEFQAGSGAPEIYTASLHIASELPRIKKLVYEWRRTIFVWISISSFTGNVMVVLLFCRPVVLLGGKRKIVGDDKKLGLKNVSW